MSGETEGITGFVRGVLERLGVPADVAVQRGDEGPVTIAVQASQDAHILIGKNGENLRALEHVARAAWARQTSGSAALIVDINDYRGQKMKEMLERIRDVAQRVRDTRRSESLEPMTSYERRIVHTELASHSDLATESIGLEPRRRVVIKPL